MNQVSRRGLSSTTIPRSCSGDRAASHHGRRRGIAFLIIGFVLPVLPLHVHLGLGLSTFIVGVVTGSQFVASVISRVWSGRFADRRGAKQARSSWACLVRRSSPALFYLAFARLCGDAMAVRDGPHGRSCAAGRRRKLHHYRCGRVGAWPLPAGTKMRDASSHGWAWRCSPRRPWAHLLEWVFTQWAALPPSPPRPQWFLF